MSRAMNASGQELLDQLNPLFTQDPDIQGTLNALGSELDNVDTRISQVTESIRADGSNLEAWEKLFSVPVPEEATEAQRRATLRLYFRRLSRGTNGSTWEQRMGELIGSAWRYNEGDNYIGQTRYRFNQQSDFTDFTYDIGSATDLWASSDGEGKLVMKWGTATLWQEATRSTADYYGQITVTIGEEEGLWGLLLKRQSNNNALGFLIDADGTIGMYRTSVTGGELVIDHTFTSDPLSVSVGDQITVKAHTYENTIAFDAYDESGALLISKSHTLTGSWITYYGIGVFGDYGFTLGAASADWSVTDLILGTYYGLSTPDYTIRITIPYTEGGTRAGAVEAIARSLTPAHLDIITEYDVGFLLGTSELGEEAL